MNQMLSWVGCALLLIGLKKIGDKDVLGFFVASLAEILWIVWGMLTKSYALVFMSTVILLMYVRAIVQWKKSGV